MSNLQVGDVLLGLVAITALLAGWIALRWGSRIRSAAGLPPGRLAYADTGDWRPPEKPLFSARYGLAGKPDYLVATQSGLVPVEVKSSLAPAEPYPSHVLQLAAYCLLLEEAEGQAPPYGLLKYKDAVFEIRYTYAVRDELLRLLDEMRQWHSWSSEHGVPRGHNEPRRCAGCGYRSMCDESLA